jgi:hypothetical protein
MRRTFLGEIESRAATRDTLRPSRSQTRAITISANSSLICRNVFSPTAPCDHAFSAGCTLPLRRIFAPQRLQILPHVVVGLIRPAGRPRQVVRLARRFRIVEKRIALRQSLPQIRIREQQMMLGMLRQINRLLTELQRTPRVASRIGAPPISSSTFAFSIMHSRMRERPIRM